VHLFILSFPMKDAKHFTSDCLYKWISGDTHTWKFHGTKKNRKKRKKKKQNHKVQSWILSKTEISPISIAVSKYRSEFLSFTDERTVLKRGRMTCPNAQGENNSNKAKDSIQVFWVPI
jgi:hypothetical protein